MAGLFANDFLIEVLERFGGTMGLKRMLPQSYKYMFSHIQR